MINRRTSLATLFYIMALLLPAVRPPATVAGQVQREDNNLRITAVNTGEFPTVGVRVLTTTAGSAPIADLTRLVVRENGVPIPDATAATTPVGIDLALVIDANPDLLLFDDRSGLSRRDKLAAGIAHYAEQFMDPVGLDRVSVIVPDETGEGATFLIQDATQPGEVAAAVNAYAPLPPRVTPLQAMLTTAIDHLAAGDEGRFRAILLYTDGARLDRQLDYQPLIEAAQAANIPIYAAVLGADASAEEIANVSRLVSPTNGLYVHMPEPEAADPIYAIFQAQGRQAELTYQSALRQSGTHNVSVSLGNARDTVPFELTLTAPQVTIDTPPETVRRAGSAVDTPLTLLQPAVLPLTVRVIWPDGRSGSLAEVDFRVDDVPQPLSALPPLDNEGVMSLRWDISNLDAGDYRLEVEIVDALGFRAAAVPVDITIEVARPVPPTPTPAPTRVPLSNVAQQAAGGLPWPALLAAVVIAGVIMVFALWRRRRDKKPVVADAPMPRIIPAAGPPPGDHVAVLEWQDDSGSPGDQIVLVAADVTFGSDPDAVDVVIDDPGVSRLHARVRRAANNEFWLYDEGSIAGTFLNYERLGLAPRLLQHNDVIQFGRVTLRFRLELPGSPGDW